MKIGKTALVVLSIAMLMAVGSGVAQSQNLWKEINMTETRTMMSTVRNEPTTFKVFELDLSALDEELSKVPFRATFHEATEKIMAFPNHEGELERFKVMEASIMHPDLAAKYPSIKSYAGQGIDDPSATIRFSVSDQRGFHGMISSGKHPTSYIDPYSADRRNYMVYAGPDTPSDERKFSCLTSDDYEQDVHARRAFSFERTNDKRLRKYRLALSSTAEYGNLFAGTGSDAQKKANILAQMIATMTRVNGIYERDLAVTLELVPNNDDIIYFGSTNADPWSGEYNAKTQEVIDEVIGDANYDIGHNFNTTGGGNAGCIGCVCTSGRKGRGYTGRANPTGDAFDVDYVAHEMGHQFGGYHTMNSCSRSGSGSTEVEPGSGSSIMGYAGICPPDVQNNSDDYFAYVNIRDISANVQDGVSASCAQVVDLANNPPTANAGPDYTIPKSTPFVLRGEGADPDGDTLTYTWEQNDPEEASVSGFPQDTSTKGPLFRTKTGTTSPNRYLPQIPDVIAGNITPTWEVIPSVSRTMEFSLTVRDNKAGGGQTSDDLMTVTVDENAGPFVVSDPNTDVTWKVGESQAVTWNVAQTNVAPVNASKVNILLSTDGGLTYPITLVSETPNDGAETITVPNHISSTSRIKVEAADNIFYDISDADFTIEAGFDDPEPPTAPGNLTSTNITSTSVDLSWTASTDNVGVIGYDIFIDGVLNHTTAQTSHAVAGLAPGTSYVVSVKAKDAAGNESAASQIVVATHPDIGCPTKIDSFPYEEGWESGIGAWAQERSDNLDWIINADGTHSNGTGPSSAIEGSYYLYVEASDNGTGYPNKRAILTSPCFELSTESAAQFSFAYHMEGISMGSLAVEASTDGNTWTTLWSESGNQGISWKNATVDLSAYAGGTFRLRLVGTTGDNYTSDMAIDQLQISSDFVRCTDVTLNLTLDNYPWETKWSLSTDLGTLIDAGGGYSTPSQSVTEGFCLDSGCYTFQIDDSLADGICCEYGNGSYSVTDALGHDLASGGSFGASEIKNFCVGAQ